MQYLCYASSFIIQEFIFFLSQLTHLLNGHTDIIQREMHWGNKYDRKKTTSTSESVLGMAGLQVVISENMAAVIRLLPSIRTQMASLTWPLLIFQHALCSHHLETGIRNKLLRTKGPFSIKRQGGGVKVSRVHIWGECVLPAMLYILEFLPNTHLSSYPAHMYAIVFLHVPCISPLVSGFSTSTPAPLRPPTSSMCWGQSQIYNNCQSQGWQIN